MGGGLPVGTRRSVTVTLDWDNPIADYDMDVNGTVYQSSEANEVASLGSLVHCAVVSGEAYNFIGGLPIDSLSLSVRVS
ncbi:hypothetical protein BH23ACT9_BH23ACT9_33440 [soil metagenome]